MKTLENYEDEFLKIVAKALKNYAHIKQNALIDAKKISGKEKAIINK